MRQCIEVHHLAALSQWSELFDKMNQSLFVLLGMALLSASNAQTKEVSFPLVLWHGMGK